MPTDGLSWTLEAHAASTSGRGLLCSRAEVLGSAYQFATSSIRYRTAMSTKAPTWEPEASSAMRLVYASLRE